jgi:hypothetical protein
MTESGPASVGDTTPATRGEASGGVAPAVHPNRSRWRRGGRRAARIYLVVAGLALVAMLVETVLGPSRHGQHLRGHPRAPWSMLAASFLPPLPDGWPLPAGLAVRMVPLALFMLLNAAIIAGIAARSQRDLSAGHAAQR